MPIYEFYCAHCNTIFNFFARTMAAAGKTPNCPKCRRRKLSRQVSIFAMTHGGQDGEKAEDPLAGANMDESRMEQAMTSLASEAEKINEDDPRQAAQLMRKFSKMTGVEFTGSMENALQRLEAGEDPDSIEADMGEALQGEEDPFILPGQKTAAKGSRRPPPSRDETLYDL